jgi:DEAD/DEAH box helicase domain-containing protein
VQSIGEIIQTIARQRGRGETPAQVTLFQLEAAAGERISHLPIESELAQAWVALTGEPFRPHQAHALTALRRGEPVALRAASADVAMTAHLLLYAMLLADHDAAALVVVPDAETVRATQALLARINLDLPSPLRIDTTLLEPNRRPDHHARIAIATPDVVHTRLLRHHDRAWRLFWPRLRLVMLPEIQRYNGVAAAHLADLLVRIERVAAGHGGQAPNLLATLLDVAAAEPALTSLLGNPWKVVPADDGGRDPATLAVWRHPDGAKPSSASWLRDAPDIATALQRQGYQVHITCRAIEQALLAPIIGDLPRVTFGPNLGAGQVLIAAGYPGSHSALRRMLRAGYAAVVLLLGDLPHEQALARHVDTLLSDPASTWLPAPTNAYVLAKHVLCAATEQPLTEAEAESWGVKEIVARLVEQGQLVDLPDPEVAWKPTDAVGDPYLDWSLRSASGGAIMARTEQGQAVDLIEPAQYERWAFPNAALPPGVGGFRVLSRDDDSGTIALRLESNGRRTYPLRRCEVALRETRETRSLTGGRAIGWGRVVVNEEIYGYREAAASSAPADIALKPTLHARWTAPACWFDLATAVQVNGQLIGWSLAAALPLRALCDFTDSVPCYDHEQRRLYLVDAQPGGNGLSQWTYAHAEELLPLAYDIALACRNDPLLEPLSRVDMDWLLALLGRPPEAPVAIERARAPEPVRRTELIEGPPPAAPTIVSPASPSYGSAPARRESTSKPAPAQPEKAPAPAPPHRARTPEPPRSRERQPDMFEPRDRARDAQPRAPDRPAPTPPPAAPNQPPKQPDAARSNTAAPARPASGGPPTPPPERSSRSPSPKARPEPPPPPIDDDIPADANALIERLRRQRHQREAAQSANERASRPQQHASNDSVVEQRFAAGDAIFCLPYGDGVVRASRIEDGQELLTVNFPAYGDLTIDPAKSLVRKLDNAAPEEDDLL